MCQSMTIYFKDIQLIPVGRGKGNIAVTRGVIWVAIPTPFFHEKKKKISVPDFVSLTFKPWRTHHIMSLMQFQYQLHLIHPFSPLKNVRPYKRPTVMVIAQGIHILVLPEGLHLVHQVAKITTNLEDTYI